MTNDTIADMLTRIRNANLAKHQIVQIPSTKITKAIANVLFNEGLIDSFEELSNGVRGSLLLSLKYTGIDRKPVIEKIQRISKPGLRVYSNSKKMPRVLGGFGTAIISTSRGLMTDRQARSEGIGGEILCYIW
jgi:small subunit ribosomal protein S8|tara:strand:+ start:1013 stop:1411 length:399 start_codon:yes stop_codon:yes gene_type:complete